MITLPESITSPQDMLEAIEEIRSMARLSAHEALLKRTKGAAHPAPALSKSASELLGAMGKKAASSDLHALADELQSLYKSAPHVDVTLAAPVTPALREELTRWFRANISSIVLLRIQFNRALLGGIVVRCGSHIYDWSFRSSVLASSDRFAEVLSNV